MQSKRDAIKLDNFVKKGPEVSMDRGSHEPKTSIQARERPASRLEVFRKIAESSMPFESKPGLPMADAWRFVQVCNTSMLSCVGCMSRFTH